MSGFLVDKAFVSGLPGVVVDSIFSPRGLRMELANLARRTVLGPVIESYRLNRELHDWVSGQQGDGSTPALVKRALLRSIAAGYRLTTLVETGTYLGGTTYALRHDFSRIITVELGEELVKNARKRLGRFKHITVEHGDSAVLFRTIVPSLTGPTLFFLDGHYSGGITARADKDTPIAEELECVLSDHRFQHVIVIDDARCFDGQNGYPTLDELRTFVKERAPRLEFSRHTDLIVFAPGGPAAHIGPSS